MVAEIQQTSDCTYRIYDYNRRDADGKLRELHTAEAMDAIDFSAIKGHAHTHYHAHLNETATLASCPYFTTNLIPFDTPIRKNLEDVDTFVVYLCVEGIAAVKAMETIVPLHAGECVLVPAVADSVELFCEGPAKLLEVYVDTTDWEDSPSMDNDWVAQFIGGLREQHHDHCGCGHDHCDCDHDDHHHHPDGCDCGGCC
jgi:mannose-6-phosphate isomerase